MRISRKIMLAVVVAAFTMALTTSPGAADELQGTLKKIIETKLIRIGYQKDVPPFPFAEGDGKPRGYTVELCQRVVARIRHEFDLPLLDIEWVEVNSTNRFQWIADGTIDLECAASVITISRMKQVDFSAMTWIDTKTFLVKRGLSIKTSADLAGKRVAVAAGTTTEPVLRNLLLGQALQSSHISTQLVVVKDRIEALDSLVRGSVDAFAAGRMLLVRLARTAPGAEQLALADYQFSYEPYALALRRNDADFKFAVNQALATLYRTGEVKQIYSRWFGDLGSAPPMLDSLFELNGLQDSK